MASEAPVTTPSATIGRHISYPDNSGQRIAEGGLRSTKTFKSSKPDLPLVTIITVSLNSSKTLAKCIHSVLQQTYENIEYVIVDGASKDGTLDVIRQHEAAIDYYISEPDRGLYHAMNKGLELASGEYILILNSDDWYDHDCVESLVKTKMESGADFVSALAQYVDKDGKHLHVTRSMPFDESVRLRMPLRHETMLIPAAIYNDIGRYDERFRIIADFHLTLRMYDKRYTHFEIKRPLMFFRNSGVSSTNLEKLFYEREILLGEQFPIVKPADIRILAEHGKLTPSVLRIFLEKYSADSNLVQMLIAYVRDQKSAGAIRWIDFETRSSEQSVKITSRPNAPDVAKMLKIATFCSMDHGGAGTGTQRRVKALRDRGVDAQIFSLIVKTSYSYVNRIGPALKNGAAEHQSEIWREVKEKAIRPAMESPGFKGRELFSLSHSVLDFRDLQEVFKGFDVVHLHWVVGMLDYARVGDCLADKPVIWTLADMNAFTGGCHYSEGCEEYQRECKKCHLLGDNSNLAHDTWKVKRDAYARIKNLHVICPSKWIADRVRMSSLLGNRPIHYIPNAFPISSFLPSNKLVARMKLGLPIGKKLLLFGADSLANQRKGGELLTQSLKQLKNLSPAHDVEVIVFGSSAVTLPLPVHSLGYVSDDKKLALAYSAADVFLSPSLEDSGPMTVGEAMCCGTPVVAFTVGYAPDIINHKENGYIVDNFDPADFTRGIQWALDVGEEDAIRRSIRCREAGVDFHDPEKAVARHLAVYRSALER